MGKGNNIQIAINFYVNLGDETNCAGGEDETEEHTSGSDGGIDIDINGEEVISDGEPVTDDERPLPTEDCAEVCQEYEQCQSTVQSSFEVYKQTLNNASTVEMLYQLETNIFMTVEEFRQNLLDDMAWDISEGTTSFAPLTIDDIPSCPMDITPVPMNCIDEIQPKLEAIEEARLLEVMERNF